MSQFGHQNGFHTVSVITGPSHVFLGIRFSEDPLKPMELIKRPPVGGWVHEPLDEKRIAESILAGVTAANAKMGTKLSVAQAFYVENDSPRYDQFEQCPFLLASNALNAPKE